MNRIITNLVSLSIMVLLGISISNIVGAVRESSLDLSGLPWLQILGYTVMGILTLVFLLIIVGKIKRWWKDLTSGKPSCK